MRDDVEWEYEKDGKPFLLMLGVNPRFEPLTRREFMIMWDMFEQLAALRRGRRVDSEDEPPR